MTLINRWIVSTLPLVPRSVVRKIADRYIAGETLREAVASVQRVNQQGLLATLDLLGEDVTTEEQALFHLTANLENLRTIADLGLRANLSVKPTAMGLKVSPALCRENMRRLLGAAKQSGNFIRFEMEDSSCTEETIRIFEKLREEYDNVGIVLQACLRRSWDDLLRLGKQPKLNLRLVKGVYLEPHRIAFRRPDIVNKNYALLLEEALRLGAYVGIATHDEDLVWEALRLVRRFERDHESYEFQMLLGVGEALRDVLLERGHRLRIYIPYGKDWYAYSVRRLRENPQIAGYVLRDLLG